MWAQPLHAQIAAHILLQDSPLAGFQYRAGKKLWPQMRVRDPWSRVRFEILVPVQPGGQGAP